MDKAIEIYLIDSHGNSFHADITKSGKLKQTEAQKLSRMLEDQSNLLIDTPEGNESYVTGKLDDQYSVLIKTDAGQVEKYITSSKIYKNINEDLEAIMSLSGELVTIVNHQGIVERVSSNCKEIMGIEANDFVGKSIYELEKSGVITLSSTKKVLETLKKVTMTQQTKGNKYLHVQGFPIFNEDGSLEKILNISKDVTEEAILREKLQESEKEVELLIEEVNKESMRNGNIIVKSQKIEEVYYLSNKVAKTDATVLYLGETGVGKGVFAKYLHEASNRRDYPFITVNCSVLPEQLIESELFGYVKGAFTGANVEGKKGLIEAAENGTLFLDEIGELSLQTQAKLLQVIQEKSFTPIGTTSSVEANVRIVAATNRDLMNMVSGGLFRSDLYYRLNVVPIHIPALRERVEDIPFLLQYFLDMFNLKYQKSGIFSPQAIDQLTYYKWPGNVRELQNFVERLVITTGKNKIEIEDLPSSVMDAELPEEIDVIEDKSLKERIDQFEKKILLKTLAKSRNLKEMSNYLKVDISTISRKLKKYDIPLR